MARAILPVNDGQSDGCPLTQLVREGLLRACGSLKAAAITMRIDQGQLSRELVSGAFKFERLMSLSLSEQAVVFDYLQREIAPLSTPKARLRDLFRKRRELDDEAEQIIDGLVS
jgi:hypothetical protein